MRLGPGPDQEVRGIPPGERDVRCPRPARGNAPGRRSCTGRCTSRRSARRGARRRRRAAPGRRPTRRPAPPASGIGSVPARSASVELVEQAGQDLFQEAMADLHRMAGLARAIAARPRRSRRRASAAPGAAPRSSAGWARPTGPRAASRPSPIGALPLAIRDRQLDPRAGHLGRDLRAELERHPGLDRQEIEVRGTGRTSVGLGMEGLGSFAVGP